MLAWRRRACRSASFGAVAALLFTATAAADPTAVTLRGAVSPHGARPGTPLTVAIETTFSPPSTPAHAVLRLPRGAALNWRLFPTCSADTINARRSMSGCSPKSRIGGGTIVADVSAADVYGVPAKLTFLNGPGGRSVVFLAEAHNPVEIYEAFDAPIRRTRGRYGFELTVPVPYSLQEINDGWFTEVRSLKATVGATAVDKDGRRRGFLEATARCPASRTFPVAAEFGFLHVPDPTTVTGIVSC
jgi:hypothetical protein